MRPCRLAAPLLALLLAGCEPGPDPLSPPSPESLFETPPVSSPAPSSEPLPPPPAPASEPPVVWNEYLPSAPGLRFVGRMDDASAEGPVYAFPGGTVRLRCECRGVDVLFEDQGEGGAQHTNFVDLRVDGVSAARVALAPGVRVYPGVRGLPPGPHLIELVKRTEAYAGRIRFLGVRLQGVLLAPPAEPARRMEFIGDSITCGYGDEVSIPAPNYTEPNTGYHAVNQDISKAYGPLAARALGADWVTTCVSGRGVYRNNDGSRAGVLPLLYERLLPDAPEPAWNPARYVPDVIVINLGTNDFSVTDATGLPAAPPAEPFKLSYASFVRDLRAAYPRATLVCAVGPMLNDTYPSGRRLWTLQQRYVADVVALVRSEGDENVHYLAFAPIQGGPYGEDWHPTAPVHARMAGELATFLGGLEGGLEGGREGVLAFAPRPGR